MPGWLRPLLTILLTVSTATAQERLGARHTHQDSLAVRAASTTIARQTPSARGVYLDNPLSLGVQVAPFGSPGGLLGLTADLALLPEISLTGVVGMGTAGSVAQYGIAARPRLPISPLLALDLTAGISGGDFDRMVSLNIATGGQTETYRGCTWVNLDIGPEIRFRSHVMLHPFVGISQLVASDPPGWQGEDYQKSALTERWPRLMYLGLVVAYHGALS
jgi:hypothetical protein